MLFLRSAHRLWSKIILRGDICWSVLMKTSYSKHIFSSTIFQHKTLCKGSKFNSIMINIVYYFLAYGMNRL